jgi:hypothetical protein
MVRRRAGDADIETAIGCHTFLTSGMIVRIETVTDPVAIMMMTVQRQMRRLEEKRNGSHEQSDQLARELKNIVPNTVSTGAIENRKASQSDRLPVRQREPDAGR